MFLLNLGWNKVDLTENSIDLAATSNLSTEKLSEGLQTHYKADLNLDRKWFAFPRSQTKLLASMLAALMEKNSSP